MNADASLSPGRTRLALFGGSFNPPHVGHLAVAEAAAEAAGLDQVLWTPAATPPHKQRHRALAAAEHRLAMTRLATAGNDRFRVSDMELQRGGVSYTVDTLQTLREDHPEAELVLLLGGDSLVGLADWHDPHGIVELARLVVYLRPGTDDKDVPEWVQQHTNVVEAPPLALSSTVLRSRIAAGQTVRYLVPEPVRGYIKAHGLYRE